MTGLLYLIFRSNFNATHSQPNDAPWEQERDWPLSASPNFGIGKHIINPVGSEVGNTHYGIVSSSTRKDLPGGRSLASTVLATTVAKEEDQNQDVPPYDRTPSSSVMIRPPLSSPPSYRAPPILSANDPLLIPPPTIQDASQKLRSVSPSQSFNQAYYSIFPQKSPSPPTTAVDHAGLVDYGTAKPLASGMFGSHKRNASNATVEIGLGLNATTEGPCDQEQSHRTATYPPATAESKSGRSKHPRHPGQGPTDQAVKPLGLPTKTSPSCRDSSPHEILFRMDSKEELSPEPVRITPRASVRVLEDLVSPTRALPLWRRYRDKRMKTLPPVPITPSEAKPARSLQGSSSQPLTSASPGDDERSSQQRTALSLALHDDEQWQSQRASRPPLPEKSHVSGVKRSWI